MITKSLRIRAKFIGKSHDLKTGDYYNKTVFYEPGRSELAIYIVDKRTSYASLKIFLNNWSEITKYQDDSNE